MSQRASGYARQALDDYQTRAPWITEAVIRHFPRRPSCIWEPAAGEGFMVRALRAAGFQVHSTDINCPGNIDQNFLHFTLPPTTYIDAIVTNPPYSHATEFIEHALNLLPRRGFAAFLLRCDFDSAKTRQHLFGRRQSFWRKVVLVRRIQWFEHKIASPSYNHAWYIWYHSNKDFPTICYEPTEDYR
jgi:hypothetical protein